MKRFFATITLSIFPLVALAHGGGREVRGTIVKVTKDAIEVKNTAGKVERFTTTRQTVFTKGKVAGTVADARIGTRAIVHLGKNGRVLQVQLPSVKVGTLQGKIISRDVKKNELKVQHGDVDGIMPATTMAFVVDDAKVAALPKNGTTIKAKLHASGGEYWLTDVRVAQ